MFAKRGSLEDEGYNWLLFYEVIYRNILLLLILHRRGPLVLALVGKRSLYLSVYRNIIIIYFTILGELKIVKEVKEVAFNLIKELIYITDITYLKCKCN